MNKNIIILALLLFSGIVTSAQTKYDALRFSMSRYNATARSASMGNAFGALGGDFTSLSINPAGLAVYRSSEMSLSTDIRKSVIKTGFGENDKLKLNFSNFGIVLTINDEIGNGWKGLNFAFGYNRMHDFNRKSFAGVSKSDNSMIDFWTYDANRAGLAFDSGLAYDSGLLVDGTDEEGRPIYVNNLFKDANASQRKQINESGYQGEYVLSLGGNYNDKLYLGFTLGIQHINYENIRNYSEAFDEANAANDFSLYERLKIRGDGINAKFGLIYKFTQNLRMGLAYHTPTYYDMEDDYYAEISPSNLYEGMDGYEYKLQTPSKTVLSAAYLFGQNGLISLDCEYIDYSGAKFKVGETGTIEDEELYRDLNSEIKQAYKSVMNIRIGGEYRLNSNFSVRAGYAINNNPFDTNVGTTFSDNKILSAGFGYRHSNMFVDFAFTNTKYDTDDYFYYADGINSQLINYKNKFNDFKITLGFKF